MNGVGNNVKKFKTPILPTNTGSADSYIPVARVGDLLLHAGEKYKYKGDSYIYPDIRMIYWAGGNPFHHHQDLFRFERGWQKPDTVVVHETHWTATARRADIVLPATTTLERNDIGASSSDNYLIAMKKSIDPLEEAKSDYDIFSKLSYNLGFGDKYTENLDEISWLKKLYAKASEETADLGITFPDFDVFWKNEYLEIPKNEPGRDAFSEYRNDPLKHALSTESGKIQLYSRRIMGMSSEGCKGHPEWLESQEWLGAILAHKYPLHLLSTQPSTRLHGQFDAVGASLASKIKGREPARMHPDEGHKRGIKNGDIIKIFNDRGACLAGASLSNSVRKGVIQLSTGAWFEPGLDKDGKPLELHGNPNVLTPDRGTSDLSQGCSAQSTLVDICLYNDPLPDISVHGPPHFVFD